MPKKGYRKPGSIRDKKELKHREERTIKGLDGTMDAIIAKLEATKPLTDEDVRFVKRYGELRAAAVARQEDSSKETSILPPGKLREMIEKDWKIMKILEESGYNKGDEGKILEEYGYIRCDLCGELHTLDIGCPFKILAKGLKIKAPSDKDLNQLLK